MTNFGDVTGPRWVGGVNASASGEGGRRPVNIPDEVIEQAARIAWADEPGATIAEWDGLGPLGRAELLETARKAAGPVAEWARKEALAEVMGLTVPVTTNVGIRIRAVPDTTLLNLITKED